MTIAPVVCTVEVKASPARAFDLFTSSIGLWWPAGRTIGPPPHAAIMIEPQAGGRWFERNAEGVETSWGHVLAWEPPRRLLLAWQLDARFTYDAELVTEVELIFSAAQGGGCRVRLEHRDLERFGADAERVAGLVGGGWPSRLADFRTHADATSHG